MALSRRTGTRFQGSIWPGFVDAMTGLLMVLFFVITIFMILMFVQTERITGQESELNVLANEVIALAEALGLEQDASAALDAELKETNATLAVTLDATTQQERLIAQLSAQTATQAAALETAENKITGFEAQVAGLLADRDTARAQVADLETREATLLSEQEALNLALAQVRDEVDAQAEAARLSAARREALDAMVADLQAQNSTLSTDLSATQEALSDEEARKLAEAAAAEALRERLQNSDAELTAMTLALEAQRQEAEDTLALLAAARSATGDLDTQLAIALLQLEQAEGAAATGAVAQSDLAQAQSELSGLKAQLAGLQADKTALQAQLTQIDEDTAAQRSALRSELAAAEAARDDLSQQLVAAQEALAAAQVELGGERDALRAALTQAEADLDASTSALTAERDGLREQVQSAEVANAVAAQREADLQLRLANALERLEASEGALTADRDQLRERLAAALAAKLAADTLAEDRLSEAEKREALLAQAQTELGAQKTLSTQAQRQAEVLNQQVGALRGQLGQLRALLDDAKERDEAKDVELQSLGADLNTALARVAAEQTRRAELEAAEVARLEAEAKALAAKTKDLEQYRSEFFGRLRDILGTQEGVQIEGDRFVFSSEVLFASGEVVLSGDGEAEIAKVASILNAVTQDIPSEIDWVIRVDGHTDNQPLSGTGRFADNWELSQARALSVVRYMIDAFDIPPGRLAANGFGEFQPVAAGDSETARAANRRIEIKFTEK